MSMGSRVIESKLGFVECAWNEKVLGRFACILFSMRWCNRRERGEETHMLPEDTSCSRRLQTNAS